MTHEPQRGDVYLLSQYAENWPVEIIVGREGSYVQYARVSYPRKGAVFTQVCICQNPNWWRNAAHYGTIARATPEQERKLRAYILKLKLTGQLRCSEDHLSLILDALKPQLEGVQ